ncbi:MAG: hypothetical protein IT233_02590 [Bacteroidia bacterium]|nr:hypothetical protein [Bacteroidia bacterium]
MPNPTFLDTASITVTELAKPTADEAKYEFKYVFHHKDKNPSGPFPKDFYALIIVDRKTGKVYQPYKKTVGMAGVGASVNLKEVIKEIKKKYGK